MTRVCLTALFATTLYVQAKYPHLHIHCAALGFLSNALWLWVGV